MIITLYGKNKFQVSNKTENTVLKYVRSQMTDIPFSIKVKQTN